MTQLLLLFGILLGVFNVSAFAQDEELVKGVELYREGKFQEAQDVLQKLVQLEPKNKLAWNYLGGSLANLGKNKEARAAFLKKGDKDDKKASPLKDDKELRVTYSVKAQYDDNAAMQRGLQGNVILMVEFKGDGTIGFVIVIRELSEGLAKSAVRAARAIKFEPSVAKGKPVSEIRPVSYDFFIR
jgi:tetratricopeptide (TPR) repeat protein